MELKKIEIHKIDAHHVGNVLIISGGSERLKRRERFPNSGSIASLVILSWFPEKLLIVEPQKAIYPNEKGVLYLLDQDILSTRNMSKGIKTTIYKMKHLISKNSEDFKDEMVKDLPKWYYMQNLKSNFKSWIYHCCLNLEKHPIYSKCSHPHTNSAQPPQVTDSFSQFI